MTYVEIILYFAVIGLCVFNYLKNLYDSRKPVKIVTKKFVKDANGKRNEMQSVKWYPQPPGPTPLPILGSLFTIGQYDVPFVGLTELAKIYGDIYSIKLGSTRCLVVNNLELIREVLNQNGKFFGGRPDFLRFHTLFGGDRSNCK